MSAKIGLGIITCNREEYFKECIKHIPEGCVDKIVVVNDGSPYSPNVYPKYIELIQHTVNKCVGISKNDAMRYLYQNNCEYIFLIEDDILIKNTEVFKKYIDTANKSGFYHLFFGLHGPANIDNQGNPKIRKIIDYGNDIKIALYLHCVGAFEMFHKGIIKNIGYMDEHYKNAWEHVDYSYRILKAGLSTPYWWWPDVYNAKEYLDEIKESIENSSIRVRDDWRKNINEGAQWFKHIHGYYPINVPDTPEHDVIKIVKKIKEKYSRPQLINNI